MHAAVGFDPARPTSLLYHREPDGKLRLIGAMYTAPQRADPGAIWAAPHHHPPS
jgi:hypothetical protein